MSDSTPEPEPSELFSRDLVSALEVIDDQPLTERAAGYLRLHDELARRLDASSRPAERP